MTPQQIPGATRPWTENYAAELRRVRDWHEKEIRALEDSLATMQRVYGERIAVARRSYQAAVNAVNDRYLTTEENR